MAARVQVIVEAKDATSGVLRGITSQLGGLGRIVEDITGKNINWGNVATQVGSMVVAAAKDAIKVTQEYSAEVRDLALVSGQGAEEASRLLQVLDDFEITADDVNTAVRKMTQQGLTPTVDTLAKLSDEYLKINNAQEKNEFILKNLGRSGLQWVNVLNKGGTAIRELSAGVSENLILTEENIAASERYRLALDGWNDAAMGLKIRIGNELLPVLTDALHTSDDLRRAQELAAESGVNWTWASQQQRMSFVELAQTEREATSSAEAFAKATDGSSVSLKEQEEAAKAAEAAAKALSDTNLAFVGVLGGVVSENQRYKESTMELQAEQGILLAEKEKLISQGYREEGSKIGEVNAKLDENMAKMKENEAAHKQWTDAKIGDLLLQQLSLGGLEKKELAYYLGYMQHTGLMTKADIEMTQTIVGGADELVEAYDEEGEAVFHVGERSLDASGKMETLNEGQAKLGSDIRSNSLPAAAALSRTLSGLPAYITSTVDLYINTYRNTYASPHADTGSSSAALDALRDVTGGGRQSGGTVYAGNPYMVGERGAEPFFPAQNGRVLGHAESLHAMSLGGGGNTNYFYGPVTIAPDAESGSDLLSIR